MPVATLYTAFGTLVARRLLSECCSDTIGLHCGQGHIARRSRIQYNTSCLMGADRIPIKVNRSRPTISIFFRLIPKRRRGHYPRLRSLTCSPKDSVQHSVDDCKRPTASGTAKTMTDQISIKFDDAFARRGLHKLPTSMIEEGLERATLSSVVLPAGRINGLIACRVLVACRGVSKFVRDNAYGLDMYQLEVAVQTGTLQVIVGSELFERERGPERRRRRRASDHRPCCCARAGARISRTRLCPRHHGHGLGLGAAGRGAQLQDQPLHMGQGAPILDVEGHILRLCRSRAKLENDRCVTLRHSLSVATLLGWRSASVQGIIVPSCDYRLRRPQPAAALQLWNASRGRRTSV